MAEERQPGEPDAESIEPVSSLRSKFEALNATPSSAPTPRPKPKPPALVSVKPRLEPPRPPNPRRSLDIPRDTSRSSHDASPRRGPSPSSGRQAPTPPKSRSASVAFPTPRGVSPQRSPLLVSISSPTSPPASSRQSSHSPTRSGPPIPSGLRLNTPPNGPFRIPSRVPSPGKSEPLSLPRIQPRRNASPSSKGEAAQASMPPPVNRAAKPRPVEGDVANPKPINPTHLLQRKVSPFNTPPHSDESSPAMSPDVSSPESPPPLPMASRPVFPASSNAGSRRPGSGMPQESTPVVRPVEIEDESAPALPPRRTYTSNQDATPLATSAPSRPSALTMGFGSRSRAPDHARSGSVSASSTRPQPVSATTQSSMHRFVDGQDRVPPSDGRNSPRFPIMTGTVTAVKPSVDLSDYPDSSRASRRPPFYPLLPRSIAIGHETKLMDVCGDLICTTGVVTRVWSMLTGKLVLSMAHGDMIRATAVCFKPTRNIEDDGLSLWLGTNTGEMMEIDVARKKIVEINASVHARREIIKLWRHGTSVWSLDEEGKLFVWPGEGHGSPDLKYAVSNGRVGRRPTASIVVVDELWLAFGRDIRVVVPDETQELSPQQASPQKQVLQATNDVTSAAYLQADTDRIFFGQSDGKIAIFSRKQHACIEILSVSLNKIHTLIGVGPYLWSGQITGKMEVYDPTSKPWKVKKSWPAHEHSILSLSTDHNSIWKMDKLPVVSLGTSSVHIWDGLLEEDWLDDDLQQHTAEFSTSNALTSLVLTWNVGATKPTDLRYDEEDSNFFRDLLQAQEPPDFIVFGLQELVDLEDKALTAKSFFKSRQKDTYGHEQLSSVYRAWRDYLSRSLDDAMPMDEPYALLHTASLVGLFTCVFLKATHKSRIKDVQAAEIKTGMGGLHGNKGAIAVRLVLDDSSICFINCHLAAGQSSTNSRNNDVASILESSPLPPPNTSQAHDVFSSGGDGSMILDHEICILHGDLNYRIDTIPRDNIIAAIRQNNLAKLLERDQLILSKRKHPGFRLRQFKEGEIDFAPTYKYDVGSDTYDTSEKRRSPAWCDRILYRGPVRQVEYRRHEVRVSDHRPVTARFELNVKRVQPNLWANCMKASEARFAKEKKSVSDLIKLKYLQDVFNLDAAEGGKLIEA